MKRVRNAAAFRMLCLAAAGEELNIVKSDLKTKLRKKQYPFKTAARQAKGGKGAQKRARGGQAADATASDVAKKARAEGGAVTTAAGESHAAVAASSSPPAAAAAAAAPGVSVEPEGDDTPLTPREKRPLDLQGKVYIAPLTTVGNLPYRRIMVGLGADVTVSEMALAHQLLKGENREWALVKRHPCEKMFGLQVAGAHPEDMGRLAELVQNELTVDFVDVNMGCPIDLVCQRGMGSTLMGRQAKIRGIIKNMTSMMDAPLTLKMRIGIDDKKPIAHKVVQAAREVGGVHACAVHGRSKEQRYTREANWDYISRLVDAAQEGVGQDGELLPHMPIIGNGDIMTWQDWEAGMATGVTTCMLARGALIKPWLPTEIKERRTWDISSRERLDILKDFAKYGLEHWGSDDKGVARTRRFLLEWLSFTWRYVPVGLMERMPQRINQRPPLYVGRDDLETLMASPEAEDWVKLSEIILGKVPPGFTFKPKHKANSYSIGGTSITSSTLSELDATFLTDALAGTGFGKRLQTPEYSLLSKVMAEPDMPIVGSYEAYVSEQDGAAAPPEG